MLKRSAVSVWGIWIGGLVALAAAVMIAVILRSDILGRGGSGLPKAFTYDISDLRPVDPNLLLYDEAPAAKIPTGFKEARGLAVCPDGRILVAGDEAVKAFDADGEWLKTFPTGGSARCLAVAGDGTIYAGVGDHVEVYDPNGERKAVWPAPKDECVVTCVTSWEDQVLAGFFRKRSGFAARYDRSGRLLNQIESRDEAGRPTGFRTPSPHLDLAVAPDGLVRIANPGMFRVEAYTLDGEPQPRLNWGKSTAAAAREIEGFVPCCNPTDLAILHDGGFVTSEKGLPRVKTYNAAGDFEGVVAGADRFAPDAAGLDLAVDAQGRILVLDPPGKAVRVFVRKRTPPPGADPGARQ